MKKHYLTIILAVIFASSGLLQVSQIENISKAQNDPFSQLVYPIVELDNCKDRQDCELFCEQEQNMAPCLDFSQTHNLMSQEDIEMGRKMLKAGQTKGPGGCNGIKACELYCDQISHIKECIIFAEQNGLLLADELREAKKVIQAIDRGLTPPKCKAKKECDVYCSKPENMEECITFGEAAGLIPENELQEAKKVLEAVKKGAKPPACAGKKECDIYCSQTEHMQECMEFALAAGFMPSEEIENAKKTLEALKKGVRPPNCQGKEQCDIYCSQVEHMQECMEFGIAAGFIPPEEIEGVKRSLEAIKKGVRPPNCQGKEQCDIYCSQDEHFDECVNFAEAAGFMSKEDAEKARKTRGKGPGGCKGEEECKAFCENPENMEACIDFAVLVGDMTQEEADRAKQGMQQMGGQMPGQGQGQGQGFSVGPGGCKTEEECKSFCEKPENLQECMQFGPGGGGGMAPGQEMMPLIESGQQMPGILQQEGQFNPDDSFQPQPGMGMPLQQEMPLYQGMPLQPDMTVPPSQEQINQYQQDIMQQQIQQGQMPPQEFIQTPQIQPQIESTYPIPEASAPPAGEVFPPPPEPAPLPPSSLLRSVDMFLANLIFALTQ